MCKLPAAGMDPRTLGLSHNPLVPKKISEDLFLVGVRKLAPNHHRSADLTMVTSPWTPRLSVLRSQPWPHLLEGAQIDLIPPRPSVLCIGAPASGPGRWLLTYDRKSGYCLDSYPRAFPPGSLLSTERPGGKEEPFQQQEDS